MMPRKVVLKKPSGMGFVARFEAIAAASLDSSAKALLFVLAKHLRSDVAGGGVAWPSLKTLAAQSGMSEDTASRTVARLEKAGIIVTVSKAAQGRSARRSIIWEALASSAPRMRVQGSNLKRGQRSEDAVSTAPRMLSLEPASSGGQNPEARGGSVQVSVQVSVHGDAPSAPTHAAPKAGQTDATPDSLPSGDGPSPDGTADSATHPPIPRPPLPTGAPDESPATPSSRPGQAPGRGESPGVGPGMVGLDQFMDVQPVPAGRLAHPASVALPPQQEVEVGRTSVLTSATTADPRPVLVADPPADRREPDARPAGDDGSGEGGAPRRQKAKPAGRKKGAPTDEELAAWGQVVQAWCAIVGRPVAWVPESGFGAQVLDAGRKLGWERLIGRMQAAVGDAWVRERAGDLTIAALLRGANGVVARLDGIADETARNGAREASGALPMPLTSPGSSGGSQGPLRPNAPRVRPWAELVAICDAGDQAALTPDEYALIGRAVQRKRLRGGFVDAVRAADPQTREEIGRIVERLVLA